MQTYAKLINGQLIYPPKNKINEDGSTTLRYDKDVTRLVADGYKPLVIESIEYNPEIQVIEATGSYEETEEAIIIKCTVRDKTEEELVEAIIYEDNLLENENTANGLTEAEE